MLVILLILIFVINKDTYCKFVDLCSEACVCMFSGSQTCYWKLSPSEVMNCVIRELNPTEMLSSYQCWLMSSLSTSWNCQEEGAAHARRSHFPTTALLFTGCFLNIKFATRLSPFHCWIMTAFPDSEQGCSGGPPGWICLWWLTEISESSSFGS